MIELWLVIIGLTLLAIAIICWPLIKLLRSTQVGSIAIEQTEALDRQQQNIKMFEQRLTELQLEHQQGVLGDQELAALTLELEKNLLSDASQHSVSPPVATKVSRSQLMLLLAFCALLPALSLGFYAKYGSAEEVLWSINKNQSHQLPEGARPTPEQAIALLEEELARNPDNAEGWYMLAGAYMGTNQFKQGALSFAKVLVHLPESSAQYASVVGQYAQALFFLDNKVNAEVKVQIQRALAIDANEVVSLGLLGIAAFEASEYQEAINFWNQSLLNAEPNAAQSLRAGIVKAEQRMAELGLVVKKERISKLMVIVDVEVTEEIKNKLDGDTSLFIFARPVGGRIPLAAMKIRLSELPKRVILDDSLAMMPTAKISLQKKVEVSARISMSGQPLAQKGDFESQVLQVEVATTQNPIKLLINKVVQ